MLQDLKLDRWCNRLAFESIIKTLTSVRKAMDHCEDQSWQRKENPNRALNVRRKKYGDHFPQSRSLDFFVDFLLHSFKYPTVLVSNI